jgi:hypothetical protein
MMEATRTSEMSVDIQLRTWQYIPEDSELQTCRRESLKSHIVVPPHNFEPVTLALSIVGNYDAPV